MWTPLTAYVVLVLASPPEQLTICEAAEVATKASGWAYAVDKAVDCKAKQTFRPKPHTATWFETGAVLEGLVLVETARGTDVVQPAPKLRRQLNALSTACDWGTFQTTVGELSNPPPLVVRVQRKAGEIAWVTGSGDEQKDCLLAAVRGAKLALPKTKGTTTFHFSLLAAGDKLPTMGVGGLGGLLVPEKASKKPADSKALLKAYRRAEKLERRRLWSCFRRATGGVGKERMTGEFTLTIDDGGRVERVEVDGGTAPRDVLDCYAHRVQGMSVELPPGSPGGTIVWSMDFASLGMLGGESDGPSRGELLD